MPKAIAVWALVLSGWRLGALGLVSVPTHKVHSDPSDVRLNKVSGAGVLLHVSFAQTVGLTGDRRGDRYLDEVATFIRVSKSCFQGVWLTLDPQPHQQPRGAVSALHSNAGGRHLLQRFATAQQELLSLLKMQCHADIQPQVVFDILDYASPSMSVVMSKTFGQGKWCDKHNYANYAFMFQHSAESMRGAYEYLFHIDDDVLSHIIVKNVTDHNAILSTMIAAISSQPNIVAARLPNCARPRPGLPSNFDIDCFNMDVDAFVMDIQRSKPLFPCRNCCTGDLEDELSQRLMDQNLKMIHASSISPFACKARML